MRFIRYWENGKAYNGWVYEDKVGKIDGDIFGEFRRLEATKNFSDVKILPPILPGKIICVGRNYLAHASEHGVNVPDIPLLFLKPPSSIIGPFENIILPPQSNQVEHEAELAIAIGREGRWISPDQVKEYIFGFTIANDVTARDLQNRDDQWTRAKGFDTFCPIGPWIDTDLNPVDALITCKVNAEVRQMSSTRDMIFPVTHLVAFISSVMTLFPGDLILTGTPSGVGILSDGDVVEIEIEGIGILQNHVVKPK
jgi:2-keto-4-pentenoate hydratase/2-oxohepta-3-ene-1,7-dioic acid hydratase in catechol pathway